MIEIKMNMDTLGAIGGIKVVKFEKDLVYKLDDEDLANKFIEQGKANAIQKIKEVIVEPAKKESIKKGILVKELPEDQKSVLLAKAKELGIKGNISSFEVNLLEEKFNEASDGGKINE